RRGGGGVLGGLLKIVGAPAELVEKPGVLYSDDRLRREILEQRNLLVAKRSPLRPVARKHAQDRAVLSQRQQQVGAHPAAPGDSAGDRIAELRQGPEVDQAVPSGE